MGTYMLSRLGCRFFLLREKILFIGGQFTDKKSVLKWMHENTVKSMFWIKEELKYGML